MVDALRNPRRRRAVILILVLWIVAVLSIMAYSVMYRMTLETRLTSLRKKSIESRALARAGLARAFVDLRNDMIFDTAEGEDLAPFDAEGDFWAMAEPEEKTDVELGAGTYTVVVEDAERYLNLKSFTPANKLLLQKIIERIGYEEEDAKIVAAAIIDYADADEQPALDSSTGREGIAYGILRAEDLGERARPEDVEEVAFPNEPYLTVDALLDVYGVTPDLFFGPGTPEAEYFNSLRPPTGGKLFQIKRARGRRGEVVRGLRDYFTVHGSGTLNMNTAPEHVLAALFEAAGNTDGDRAAERFIRTRRGGSGGSIDNDNAFKTIQDVQNSDIGGILGAMQALHPLDVRSTVFTVRATGRVGDSTTVLEAVVERSLATLQRDETFEAIDRAREREALYEDRRKRRQDRDNERVVRVPNIRILSWNQP